MAEARSSPRRHACSVARPEIRRHAELIHVGPSVPPPASLRRDVCLIRSSLSLSLPWTGAEPGFHSLGSQEHPGWLQNSPVCAPRVCLSRPGLAGAAASEVVETRLLSVGGCARSTSGSPDQEFQTQVRSLHRERGGKTGQCRCGGAHSLTPVIPVAADRRTFSDLLSSFVYLRLDQRKATEITNTSFSRCLDLKAPTCAPQDTHRTECVQSKTPSYLQRPASSLGFVSSHRLLQRGEGGRHTSRPPGSTVHPFCVGCSSLWLVLNSTWLGVKRLPWRGRGVPVLWRSR
ncbi:corticotropin-releasing factor-binding protein isoform X2 [Lepus europaeus]|uniref:corticotropin-releasing factor-binding protein isoform X2 n=1 Tax=Lepus europaeus TaxID=9983 RepID=UPI002B4A0103|nr:corticotropin-releasing factor-binding protein isoform X2 [Lepus europaeus]